MKIIQKHIVILAMKSLSKIQAKLDIHSKDGSAILIIQADKL